MIATEDVPKDYDDTKKLDLDYGVRPWCPQYPPTYYFRFVLYVFNEVTLFMNSFSFSTALLVINLVVAFPANALEVATGLTISSIGSEANGTLTYISANGHDCPYAFYASDGVNNSKNALSIAISAKALGKTIRIDYNREGVICRGYNIYMEP